MGFCIAAKKTCRPPSIQSRGKSIDSPLGRHYILANILKSIQEEERMKRTAAVTMLMAMIFVSSSAGFDNHGQ